jgi:hypothetical protein
VCLIILEKYPISFLYLQANFTFNDARELDILVGASTFYGFNKNHVAVKYLFQRHFNIINISTIGNCSLTLFVFHHESHIWIGET